MLTALDEHGFNLPLVDAKSPLKHFKTHLERNLWGLGEVTPSKLDSSLCPSSFCNDY